MAHATRQTGSPLLERVVIGRGPHLLAVVLTGLFAIGCQPLGSDPAWGPDQPAASPAPVPAAPTAPVAPQPVAPPPSVAPAPPLPPLVTPAPPSPTATPKPTSAGPPPGAKRIVLVVGNAQNPAPGDQDIFNFLRDIGFSVVLADENDRGRDLGKDIGLVIIASSANANQIGNDWDGDLPVLVMNANLFVDMNLTDGRGNNAAGQVNGGDIDIATPTHPIAAGLTGRLTVLDSNDQMNFATPAPSATVIATLDRDKNRAVIFAYDAGAQLADGGGRGAAGASRIARNRRTGFFLRGNNPRLQRDGETLFEAAVFWTWSGQAEPAGSVPASAGGGR